METKVTKKVTKKKAVKKDDDLIECYCVRTNSWGKKGETKSIPRHAARILQDNGVLRVVI